MVANIYQQEAENHLRITIQEIRLAAAGLLTVFTDTLLK
jgi:hypothetical protein